MIQERITIGELSKRTGCKIPTIRYYENVGLITTPQRSEGNTRIYNEQHIQQLHFIQHCRELGFDQSAIKELLDLTGQPEYSCDQATEISKRHLDDINQKVARLQAMKSELEHMIISCSGGKVADCQLLEILADHTHGHCLEPNHSRV